MGWVKVSMIKRAEQLFVQANSVVLIGMVLVMFLLVFTNVVTRYVFGFSLNWAEELARYLMIWTGYLGAGLAMREGRHVAIEYLQERLPRPMALALRAIIGVVILLFMGTLAYLGYQYVLFAMSLKTAALQWKVGYVYTILPIGALTFIIHMLASFREYVAQVPGDDSTVERPDGQEEAQE